MAQRKSFEEWLKEVNAECVRLCGVGVEDLEDYCYRDAYDQHRSAKSVAKSAVRRAQGGE